MKVYIKRIDIKRINDGKGVMLVPASDNHDQVFDLLPDEYERLRQNPEFYRLEGGVLVFDEARYQLFFPTKSAPEKIAYLKDQLVATDYKVIKCMEATLAGDLLPYDSVLLHREREKIREQIRYLESGSWA
ncbi:MAG: hypothetical protein A2Y16_05340 [Tenericutes bacterium GWF2_57_13]|nr:MAG: hypothetical protein A2Y16_05340 [Tenericutes bacterium GWF2_57_13]